MRVFRLRSANVCWCDGKELSMTADLICNKTTHWTLTSAPHHTIELDTRRIPVVLHQSSEQAPKQNRLECNQSADKVTSWNYETAADRIGMAHERYCGSVITSRGCYWCESGSRRREPRELLSNGGQGLSFLYVGLKHLETDVCVGSGHHWADTMSAEILMCRSRKSTKKTMSRWLIVFFEFVGNRLELTANAVNAGIHTLETLWLGFGNFSGWGWG